MSVRLSVDPDVVRAYGAASAGHAADLKSAAARLSTVGAGSAAMFGPVGAAFLASLARAALGEAGAVAVLSASVATAHDTAQGSARYYETADSDVGARLDGTMR